MQAGPLQAFYNAGLYGGMPLPYGFPNPAAPTDANGDQVNAVSAAVSAAMQSQPADGIAQVLICWSECNAAVLSLRRCKL